MENSPAFQFYAADWLADEKVQCMTPAQEGYYIRALAFCWREGSLPVEDEALRFLLAKGTHAPTDEDLKVIKDRFQRWLKGGSRTPPRFVHARLEIEREKQREWKEKSSWGGIKSAQVRKRKALMARLHPMKGSSTTAEPTYEPNVNSSSSLPPHKDPPVVPHGGNGQFEVPSRKKKPRRIGEDWRPSEATLAWAYGEGFTKERVEHILKEFILYWIDDGRARASWDATFRNRISHLKDRDGVGNMRGTSKNPQADNPII